VFAGAESIPKNLEGKMRRLVWVALTLLGCASSPPAKRSLLSDGGFESGGAGWFSSGGGRYDYALTIDAHARHGGHASGAYAPKHETNGRYGTLMQVLAAAKFRGHRARGVVWVKSQGVVDRGDFWLRAQGPDSPGDGPGLASAVRRLEPESDWRRYEAVIDVPRAATRIDFGVGIAGPGRVWVDDASFTVDD
jgi:hypothetical protein